MIQLGRRGPDTCILTHATPNYLLQTWPESHPAEYTQVPGAAFLGLVEAVQQGEAYGARPTGTAKGLSPGQTEVLLGVGSYRMLQYGLKMRGPWRQRRNLSLFPDKAQFLPRKIIVCLPTFHLISQNKIHLWWREPPSPQKWDWLSAPHSWGLRHL